MVDIEDIYSDANLDQDFEQSQENYEGLCPICQYPIQDGFCENCLNEV